MKTTTQRAGWQRWLMISVALLGLGSITLLLTYYFTGFRLFDTPEPGLHQITHFSAVTESPVWSPDGKTIVFISSYENPEAYTYQLYSVHLSDGQVRRLTNEQKLVHDAAWSPDQKHLAYVVQNDICLLRMDEDRPKQCVSAPKNAQRLAWSPDGQRLLFDDGGSIQFLTMGQEELIGPPQVVGPGAFAVWSPDGQCLAFGRGDLLKHSEVWVSRADGSQAQPVLQVERGAYPFGWSPDGQLLYIRQHDFGEIHQLTALRLSDGKYFDLTNNHDRLSMPQLSPDGKRIVFESDRQSDSPAGYAFNIYVMDTPALPVSQPAAPSEDCLPDTAIDQTVSQTPRGVYRYEGIVLPPGADFTQLMIGAIIAVALVIFGSMFLFMAMLKAGLRQRPFRREARAIVVVFYGPAILLGGYLALQAGLFLSPAQRLGWQTYRSEDNTFSAAFPGKPALNNQSTEYTVTSAEDGFTYSVSVTTLPTGTASDFDARQKLDELQQALIPAGGEVSATADITTANRPGRELRIRRVAGEPFSARIEARLYVVGNRLFQVVVNNSEPIRLSSNVAVFFDSFQLLEAK